MHILSVGLVLKKQAPQSFFFVCVFIFIKWLRGKCVRLWSRLVMCGALDIWLKQTPVSFYVSDSEAHRRPLVALQTCFWLFFVPSISLPASLPPPTLCLSHSLCLLPCNYSNILLFLLSISTSLPSLSLPILSSLPFQSVFSFLSLCMSLS